MLETDCPYLTPRSKKGEENQPAFLGEIARCLGEIKGVSTDDVKEQTTRTAQAFFNISSRL